MEKANALQLRQNLSQVLKKLKKTGAPVLIEKNRQPAAVLISLEDYQKRFVDYQADQLREAVIERIKGKRLHAPAGKTSLDLLRELRQ